MTNLLFSPTATPFLPHLTTNSPLRQLEIFRKWSNESMTESSQDIHHIFSLVGVMEKLKVRSCQQNDFKRQETVISAMTGIKRHICVVDTGNFSGLSALDRR